MSNSFTYGSTSQTPLIYAKAYIKNQVKSSFNNEEVIQLCSIFQNVFPVKEDIYGLLLFLELISSEVKKIVW